jgi:hypothetical protein
MRLDELQVDSFVTALDHEKVLQTLRGGYVEESVYDECEEYFDEIAGKPRRKSKKRAPVSGHDGSVCMSANIGSCH